MTETAGIKMKTPSHPGAFIKLIVLEPLGLSVAAAARALGVTRPTLSLFLNGRTSLSAEMAIRLEKAFGGGAETWLRLQAAYDLAQAEKKSGTIKVRRVTERVGIVHA